MDFSYTTTETMGAGTDFDMENLVPPIEYVLVAIAIAIVMIPLIGIEERYRQKSPTPLPARKPKIAFYPKYLVEFDSNHLGVDISQHTLIIKTVLANLGFEETDPGNNETAFRRGMERGDFSIKLALIFVRFPQNADGPPHFVIEYGWFAWFDTGDLWRLARDIKNQIEESANHIK